MEEFQRKFEKLGYTFPSADVLEDVYLFYKYYGNPVNVGISTILLEGATGSGKTYLSEVFHKFLGRNTEYFCIQGTEETDLLESLSSSKIEKDRENFKYNLIKAIHFANEGRKIVFTIEDFDRLNDIMDFSQFLQSGQMRDRDYEMLSLTESGRRKFFVILINNSKKVLKDELLRRCSVIELPPMPPVLAYQILLRKFEKVPHDESFLRLVAKTYELLYNHKDKTATRLPSIQELVLTIMSDYQLYQTGIADNRRIYNLIRKLGKEEESKKYIKEILIKNLTCDTQEKIDSKELGVPDSKWKSDYPIKSVGDIVEKYIEDKEKEEENDPFPDIVSMLQSAPLDSSLKFLDKKNRKKIIELGVITHQDSKAIELLFHKLKFRGNPNSKFGFLSSEGENFIGVMKYHDTLVLISNKEYISPKLLIRGFAVIVGIIYDSNQNVDWNALHFSEITAKYFHLTSLNVKVLSSIPNFVLDKMVKQKDIYTYQGSNLKVIYESGRSIRYFEYFQKYRSEPLFQAIASLCQFNPELALPVAFVNTVSVKRHFVRYKLDFLIEKGSWETFRKEGWKVQIDDFPEIDSTFLDGDYDREYKAKDGYVFDWNIEKKEDQKELHVYPKYQLKNGCVFYTSERDFEQDETFCKMGPFEKEISLLARSIYGNFVPQPFPERRIECFSPFTMLATSKLIDDSGNRKKVRETEWDILGAEEFCEYYDSLSEPIAKTKVLK